MTFVGLLGILLGLLAWPIAIRERTGKRVTIFALAFITHIVTAVVYYIWVQTNTADTIMYYNDPYDFYGSGFGLGTRFVVYLVQFLRDTIGGSYLDHFLLFQAIGFWGIAVLMRTIEEVYRELDVPQPPLAYLVLFTPGMHFWTSAIGKDAGLFFAAALAVWSVMRIRRRFIGFGLAIFVMVLFRPHIALVALVSLAAATFFDPRVRGFGKVALLMGAFAGATLVLGTVESTFRVDVTNAESVSEFFQSQSQVTSQIQGGSQVVGASFPVRLLSLLFRPFFFDATGAFALISSFENAFILFMLMVIFRNFSLTWTLTRQILFVRFSVIFAFTLTILLAMVYYNVGLGLRQKMMIMPALVTLFISVIAVKQAQRRPVAVSYA